MEWTRGPIIGAGATATVHLAADRLSGDIFAVKSAEVSRSGFLRKEQSLLSKVASPRIVKQLGFCLTRENDATLYNLFIEFVPGGSLFDAIRRRGKLAEPAIKLYSRQILQGLADLHRIGVAHCDVKSRNVLIGEDGAKIADLGCAKTAAEFHRSSAGTPAFMAPEAARGERQGFEADVWAVGCTVIEMATGDGPWPEMRDSPVVPALYRIGYSESVPEFPTGLSGEGKDFLGKCLERDWRRRWSVDELLDHPFLRSPEPEFTAEMSSPSSVLEKGSWDLMEASDRSRRESGFEEVSVSSSARERVWILIAAERFTDDDDDDEDWLTVRGNCEDIKEFAEIMTETSMALVDREEEEEEEEEEEDDDDDVFDRFVFDGLSFDYNSIQLVSEYGTLFIQCNHVDILNHNENSGFDSISLSFFLGGF